MADVDLVTLTEYAKRRNIPPKRMKRMLEALNAQLGGLLIIRTAGRVFVNELALDAMRSRVERSITDRLAGVEGAVQSLDKRVTSLEVRAARR